MDEQLAELESLRKIITEKRKLLREEISIITAKNPEGGEIVFNLEQIRNNWYSWYMDHGLSEMAEVLPEEITLTKKQIETIKKLVEQEGFNYFILLPANPDQYLSEIKEQTGKQIKGLSDKQQYAEEGTYLTSDVRVAFPHQIKTQNRPNSAYLLFTKDTGETAERTKDESLENLREKFQRKGLFGFTLSEYLIFQRYYTERHKEEENPHPDTESWTWLFDSELETESGESSSVLFAFWLSPNQRLLVSSNSLSDLEFPSFCTAHTSAILEI